MRILASTYSRGGEGELILVTSYWSQGSGNLEDVTEHMYMLHVPNLTVCLFFLGGIVRTSLKQVAVQDYSVRKKELLQTLKR